MDSVLFYCVTAIAILLTGISKSGFGGVAMLAVPLMSVSVSPFVAAGITLPILLLMDGMSLWAHWQNWNWHFLKIVLPGALAGVLVGGATAEYASADLARLLVGFLSLAFVLWSIRPKRLRENAKPLGPLTGRLLGGVAGYTSFVAHAGGPPLHAYLLTQKISKSEFAATGVLFFGLVNLAKLPAFYAANLVTTETLVWSAIFAPLAPVGVWLGLLLNKHLKPEQFFRIIYIMLTVLGGKLIYDGISGLLTV